MAIFDENNENPLVSDDQEYGRVLTNEDKYTLVIRSKRIAKVKAKELLRKQRDEEELTLELKDLIIPKLYKQLENQYIEHMNFHITI